jgi:hypothetical protein
LNKLQSFSIALVLFVIAVAALLQIVHVDPVLRKISIAAVSAVSLLAAMVFFLFTYRDRE